MVYKPTTWEERFLLLKIIASLNGAAVITEDGGIPAEATQDGYIAPDRGQSVLVTAIVTMAVAVAMVALRLYTRWKYAGNLGLDDWMVIPAIIATIGFTVVQILAVKLSNLGMHIYDVGPYAMITGTRLTYAHMIIYCYAIMFTKLSIILFIRRLSSGIMWKVCNGFFVFHVLFGIASSLALAFQCRPIAAAYDLFAKLDNRCDNLIMYYVITSIGVASDMAILFLPIPIVLKLQLPLHKKAAVLFLFGLGGLACIFAILRMINLFDGVKGIDLTWDIVPVALFGQLEVTLAIIATSLPTLKVLWKRWLPKFHFSIGSKIKRSSSEESAGRSGGASRKSRIEENKNSAKESTIERPDLDTDIEMGTGIVWGSVDFGNGMPAENPNVDSQPRSDRSTERTEISTAERALLDDSIHPTRLLPSTGRSRRNSKTGSEISAESEISLSNWVPMRNNSFAVGTPLSPMPQLPPHVFDRPRKDSEVVVKW